MRIAYHYDTDLDTPEEIYAYLHCAKCLEEWQESLRGILSPRDYARGQVGYHPKGLQVVCTRHGVNVAVITAKMSETQTLESVDAGLKALKKIRTRLLKEAK